MDVTPLLYTEIGPELSALLGREATYDDLDRFFALVEKVIAGDKKNEQGIDSQAARASA